MEKLNIAIIGFGLSGQTFHAPFLDKLDRYNLHTIVSSKRDLIRSRYPNVVIKESFESVILNKDIDVVVITTPNHLHYDQVLTSLNANKHVVVEKPFVEDTVKGQHLCELADKKNLTLSVFHNRRYDDDFLTIKNIISNKTLGDIVYFESNFDRFRPIITDKNWRERKGTVAGGVLFDLGSHLIDQVYCLFGSPDSYTIDKAYQRENSDQDDYFNVTFKYNQMRAVMGSSSIAAINKPRFLVHGTLGSLISYGLDEQEGHIRSGHSLSSYSSDRTLEIKLDDKVQKVQMEKSNYSNYYEDLFEAIVNNGKNPVSAQDSLFNIKIITSHF